MQSGTAGAANGTPPWTALRRAGDAVVEAVERAGGRAYPLAGTVFAVPAASNPDAAACTITYGPIQAAIDLGMLPIVPTFGQTPGA